MVIFGAHLAAAQTPVDFFGLSGSRMTHFEKGEARIRREEERRGMKKQYSQAQSELKRLQAKGPPDSVEVVSKRLGEVQDSLKRLVESNHEKTMDEDKTKREHAAQLPLLPAFDVVAELAGEGGNDTRAIATGRTLYDVPFNGAMNTHLTVFGNVGGIVNATSTTSQDTILASANELRSSRAGLHLGMAIWYLLNSREGNASWVPNVFVGGRVNRVIARDTGEAINFSQFQMGAALSLGLGYIEGQAHPLGFSVGAVCNLFSAEQHERVFGSKKSNRWDGHMTLLVPISSAGVGILFEDTVSQDTKSAWHAGVVFTGNRKQDDQPGS